MTSAALKMPLPSSVFLPIDRPSHQPQLDREGRKSRNPVSPRSRERGVVLTLQGWNKLQTAKSQAEFRENAGDRLTLEELSERTTLSIGTISKVMGRLKPVDRHSLRMVFQSFDLELDKSDYSRPNSSSEELDCKNLKQDWDEAPDVSLFCGRETELTTLGQWVSEKHCRLVAVLGMGGIGKSTLVVKLASQVEREFEIIVWRSLQTAPSLDALLESILPFLLQAQGEDPLLPDGLDRKIAMLIDCLRSSRCLLILDGMETILASRDHGRCRTGYESYDRLLQCIGATPHQSCVILTSREKHRQIALLEGEKLPVRSFRLGAMQPTAGRELFQQTGQFSGLETEWNATIEHYGGNPLALKLVAAATRELFNGKIAEVLKSVERGLLVFDDIRDLFHCQFDRLSPLEQEVMLWLAIHQEPISLDELRENLVSTASKWELPGALNSLLRRSLIEPTISGPTEQNVTFSLQPFVIKYVLERLIRQVCHELEQQQVGLLRTHALFKVEARDQVGIQKQLILPRVAEWLSTKANKLQEIQWLEGLLQQRQAAQPSGYTIDNLLSLLQYCEQKHWLLAA